MAAGTVKVWTPGGAMRVKVNDATRRILRTLGRSAGSYSARDAEQIATLAAHAVTAQVPK